MEVSSPHLSHILDLLLSSRFEESKSSFSQPEVQEWVLNNPLDFISSLVKCFDPAKEKSSPGLADACRWMLRTLAERVADPDEIYLELLSHMDVADNDPLLLAMLKCAETCLGRMTMTKTRALDWCLMTLRETLDTVDFSDEDRIELLYNEVEMFYLACIENLEKAADLKETKEQKQHLSVFLLSQLVYTSLPERFVINFVESLAKVLPDLGYPLVYLNEKGGWKKNKTDTHHYLDEVVVSFSYEMLYYYVIHRGICYTSFPQILSPQFLFVRVGALSSQLLKNPDPSHQKQGLDLLNDILDRVDPGSISHRALSANHYPNLLQGLSNVMVYNSDLETRKYGSQTLKKLVFSFDERGRYLILFHGFRCVENQGVKGFMVTFVKDCVVQYLNSGTYFVQKLPELLSCICVLPQKAETLIYKCNDFVISLLNLLRYLIIVDPKPGKTTGVWSVEAEISSKFLLPLGPALRYSREYLNDRMKDAQMLSKKQDSGATVYVGNEVVPAPNYEEEVGGIHLRLTHLDFVQHVFEIVKENFH